MAIGLAARSLLQSTDIAPVAFATLVGPAASVARGTSKSARWLQTMTENLTSAACVESGRLNVRLEPVDVRECVETALLGWV